MGPARAIAFPYFNGRVWQKGKQWQPLWDDIREVAERQTDSNPSNDDFTHFLGAIVVDQEVKANGPSSRVVIDGQQRLTTLQLMIAAARALAMEQRDDPTVRKLEALLFLPDFLLEDTHDRLMLVPTNYDRAAFTAAVETDGNPAQPIAKGDSGHILTAYAFFRTTIGEWVLDKTDGDEPVEKLRALAEAMWDLLRLVVIALEYGDDAQAIFETLNARGTPLLAADLVKNYLFRPIEAVGGPRAAELAYLHQWTRFDQRHWREEIGQGRSRRPRIDVLLTHWLVLRTQAEVSFQAVFDPFSRYAKTEDPLSILQDLDATAAIYESFEAFDPFGVEGTFFHRLDVLETTTMMPVVLWVYGPDGVKDRSNRQRALRAIESWLVRRMLCRLTTKNYNVIALSLLKYLAARASVSGDDVVDFLLSLDGDSQRWPDDDAVVESVRTVPFYTSLTRRRLRMVLDAIEASMHDNKVGPYADRDRLTIEHVLPQYWEANWPMPESGDPLANRIERDAAKHRLGNLALVTGALNSSLSNAPWTDSGGPSKRQALEKYSQYLINKDVLDKSEWSEAQIRDRGEALAKRILRIWPRPKTATVETVVSSDLPDVPFEDRASSDASQHEVELDTASTGTSQAANPTTGRSSDELFEELKRYECECESAGLRPNSVFSYVDYARRFLSWRDGDYSPRNATGPERRPSRERATVNDLMIDLKSYELDLQAASLLPNAVGTYLIHARQFVRWLDGDFVPGSRLRS